MLICKMRCKITAFYLYMVEMQHTSCCNLTYFLFYYNKYAVFLYFIGIFCGLLWLFLHVLWQISL